MRRIIIYEANDGTRFNNEADASDRDEWLRRVSAIMDTLPACPDLGMGQFFRHRDIGALAAARIAIYRLWLRGKPAEQAVLDRLMKNEPMNGTVLDRHMTDDSGPICSAWSRLTRIDRQGREWDQWYYVDHPEESRGEVLA